MNKNKNFKHKRIFFTYHGINALNNITFTFFKFKINFVLAKKKHTFKNTILKAPHVHKTSREQNSTTNFIQQVILACNFTFSAVKQIIIFGVTFLTPILHIQYTRFNFIGLTPDVILTVVPTNILYLSSTIGIIIFSFFFFSQKIKKTHRQNCPLCDGREVLKSANFIITKNKFNIIKFGRVNTGIYIKKLDNYLLEYTRAPKISERIVEFIKVTQNVYFQKMCFRCADKASRLVVNNRTIFNPDLKTPLFYKLKSLNNLKTFEIQERKLRLKFLRNFK